MTLTYIALFGVTLAMRLQEPAAIDDPLSLHYEVHKPFFGLFDFTGVLLFSKNWGSQQLCAGGRHEVHPKWETLCFFGYQFLVWVKPGIKW